MQRFFNSFLVVVFVFVLFNFSHADVFVKQKKHTGAFKIMGREQPAKDVIETIWITKDKVRSDNENRSYILLLNEKKMYFLDNARKTYTVIPLDLDKISKAATKGEKVDSDEKQKFMDFAKNMMKIKISVVPTGESKKIRNWNCKKYIQTIETQMGPTRTEIWASEDIHIDYDLYNQFSSALMATQPGMKQMLKDMMAEMKKIKGVPVLTTTITKMMGSEMRSSQEILEVKQGTAPSGIFAVPKDFKME
ncbi:MAG TPA: DUF4412 domain-containing protein [Caldithrix sp.]|nr:DUF4412 domain-containing protein [Caldithrix sp.]